MFNKTNFSPRELSLFTALVLSVPIAILIYFLNYRWQEALISFVVILAGSYGMIVYIFQNFIYRKIKLIYKFIYQTRASKKEEIYYQYLLPRKSIDEVREDVEAWAVQRQKEIEILKKNEIFRKEFLQNISHEFKTPVFAIQGYVDTLIKRST